MARKATRVADLADEAGVDNDEALILLWDAGLDRFESPHDVIRRKELDSARLAVGLVGRNAVIDPAYWRALLGVSDLGFERVLRDLAITMSPTARRLPKGSVAKLRRLAKREGKLPGGTGVPATPTMLAQPSRSRRSATPHTPAPFVWRVIGNRRRQTTLAADDLERIHWQLVSDFAADDDPIDPPGVRSQDLLESAAFRVDTSLAGRDKYPTLEMSAAALLHAVVHNHPFHNGNKRTALVAMLVHLDRGDVTLTCSDSELFKFVLRVAQHRIVDPGSHLSDREVLHIANWVSKNSRTLDRTAHPVPWRRLRQILCNFGCELSAATSIGNRINITRKVEVQGRREKIATSVLRTQVYYQSEGADCARNTIAKIRQDLWLDEAHGVDSITFYSGDDEGITEDFINKYRKTLERLAKL